MATVTKEQLEQKLSEYRQAAEHHSLVAHANRGAAEAIEALLRELGDTVTGTDRDNDPADSPAEEGI